MEGWPSDHFPGTHALVISLDLPSQQLGRLCSRSDATQTDADQDAHTNLVYKCMLHESVHGRLALGPFPGTPRGQRKASSIIKPHNSQKLKLCCDEIC